LTYDVISGNLAVAYGAKLARVEVIPAYPITPQTTIIEYLAEFVANGKLQAEYIHSDGEHSCLGMAVGASMTGARVFTSTSSQGLAYAHEVLAQATGYRTPFVMAVTNRTLGWYWSIGPDYSDVEPELNLGWIICFAESNQEALDMVLQLYKISEDRSVMLPSMINLDGFYLSYSNERVNIPDQKLVDGWLPNYNSPFSLDPTVSQRHPASIIEPSIMTTQRRLLEEVLQDSKKLIEKVDYSYGETFGRIYGGLVEAYRCENVDAVLVTAGSMTTAARRAVDQLRKAGENIGLVKVRFMRPFPSEIFREISKRVRAFGVIDRMIQHGTNGGIIYNDLKSALYNHHGSTPVINFIAGIGGEDISIDEFVMIGRKTLHVAQTGSIQREIEYIEHKTPPAATPIKIETDTPMYPTSQGCSGCSSSIILRHLLDVLGEDTIVVNSPGCATINYPQTVKVPYFLANFAAGAAYQTGVYRALKAKGKADKVYVMGYSGDGGTIDIGLQSLSGAAERGESMIWVCYDNEAYMNTGIQRSGSTPLYSNTTNTPVGSLWSGKPTRRKNMLLIMAAHRIPYIATASVAYIKDLRRKIKRAAEITRAGEGLAFLHVHQPCTTGWYFPPERTVDIGRLAVQTGAWPVLEVDHGVLEINVKPTHLKPIKDYLEPQKRFSHLTDEQIQQIQEYTWGDWETLLKLEKLEKMPGY
jgi:pyruvate/2-oxoacid:ferredoxin oxidoreductase alpha subunit/pyruvate/2-oxoacid:ferredoxin oxidoreductase beta subunit